MNKLVRIAAGTLTATVVAAGGALAATGSPASAADSGGVRYSANTVTYGQTLKVSGTSPVSSGKVYLYAKPYHGSWGKVASKTTPASFAFSVKPAKYTQYYVRVVPTSGDPLRTSAHPISVHRKLTRPAVHPKAKTITGKVSPAYKKRLVTIQKRSCTNCAWKKAKVVRTNKWSTWTLRIPVKRMQYRAVVAASNGFKKTGGPVTQVVVRYGRAVR
ncbi:hypothetical protein AB3X52_16125 [Nocardioides sp. DS6]|uniref:Fibronectin type III domain-containing protein n=1 Tax=Nocardioides eburneus TaxID=3231482 RepID=A0ABV3T1T0_9ACTN